MASTNDKKSPPKKRIAPPKGTRDLYPEDTLRTRYIQKAWRDTSIRCGFDEIEGPTFEQAELYAVKSGDGILGELFQAFSGKSPEEIEQVQRDGRAPFALRPEFTPTLARMYAAKANTLPKPCKWFTAGPYFRAERPQRGRLREFLQWNCDVIGDDSSNDPRSNADGDCIEPCVRLLDTLGLRPADAQVHVSSRTLVAEMFQRQGIAEDLYVSVLELLDRMTKQPRETFVQNARALGLPDSTTSLFLHLHQSVINLSSSGSGSYGTDDPFADATEANHTTVNYFKLEDEPGVDFYWGINEKGMSEWASFDPRIVRGLAYYTGTVFEVIAEGERAVAGGGRYDNLIELMGGPPTPAVGFAMGDVVLGLLLEDKDLMPEGPELMAAISTPPASVRPEAFVITDNEENDPIVRRLVADLRRGVECTSYRDRADAKPWHADRYDPSADGVRPMHARQSYKSTRKLGKLLDDANKQFAKFAVIVKSAEEVTLRDLAKRDDIAGTFSASPESDNYVGRALAQHLDRHAHGASA